MFAHQDGGVVFAVNGSEVEVWYTEISGLTPVVVDLTC